MLRTRIHWVYMVHITTLSNRWYWIWYEMYIDKKAISTFETNGNKDKNPFPWLCWCTEVVTINICIDFFFSVFYCFCNLVPSRWKKNVSCFPLVVKKSFSFAATYNLSIILCLCQYWSSKCKVFTIVLKDILL